MDEPDPYSYEAIQTEQLRLCRFTEDGEILSAVLEPYPAVDAPHPPYIALSYTWGVQTPGVDDSWTLRIGRRHLAVRASLQSFVQALRAKGELIDGTWWWIDSICINQTNLQERGNHVRRMKTIYQNAEKVIVWLGPESHDSDCALDFIHFLNGADVFKFTNEDLRGTLRTILLQTQYQIKWAALKNFFLRRWWTRIWTVQESVIPSEVSFWCGPRRLTRDDIFDALNTADRCKAPDFKDTIAFHHAWGRRRAWLLYDSVRGFEDRLNLSLVALAAYFCSNEATDDRDRVYGLFGLSSNNHGLEVSYSWSVDEVYLRFAQSFITQHKSLDIISFASLFVATPGSSLPSWVPDWRARIQPFVVPLMASQSSTDYVGNLRPPRTLGDGVETLRYSAAGSKAAVYSFEGSVLLVHGHVIDAVDGLGGNRHSELVQSSGQHSQHREMDRTPTDIIKSICRSLVLDRGDRYLRPAMPTEAFDSDFMHLCQMLVTETAGAVHEEFQAWFSSTRSLLFHGDSFEDVLRTIYNNNSAMPIDPAPSQDEYIQDSFYGRFYDTVEELRLRVMTSRDGRIGMAPEKAIKGDLICLLFGCSVPMVLRREEYSDQFIVVGECFLDGCMNGQALEQDGLREEVFRVA
ncbi:hypothetical protein LTR17_004423 [Elasticomyces elasticus]|nr:hypothetical protein LTR17_004423 [Elasticomyces elasticus]